MCKQMSSGSFKNVIYKLFVYKSYTTQLAGVVEHANCISAEG